MDACTDGEKPETNETFVGFLSCQLNVAGGSILYCEKRDDISIWTKRNRCREEMPAHHQYDRHNSDTCN